MCGTKYASDLLSALSLNCWHRYSKPGFASSQILLCFSKRALCKNGNVIVAVKYIVAAHNGRELEAVCRIKCASSFDRTSSFVGSLATNYCIVSVRRDGYSVCLHY